MVGVYIPDSDKLVVVGYDSIWSSDSNGGLCYSSDMDTDENQSSVNCSLDFPGNIYRLHLIANIGKIS